MKLISLHILVSFVHLMFRDTQSTQLVKDKELLLVENTINQKEGTFTATIQYRSLILRIKRL